MVTRLALAGAGGLVAGLVGSVTVSHVIYRRARSRTLHIVSARTAEHVLTDWRAHHVPVSGTDRERTER